jgi:hypothetical protein
VYPRTQKENIGRQLWRNMASRTGSSNPGSHGDFHRKTAASCQRMRVGLILGAMGFHHVRLPAHARCCCMRIDAGVLGAWPKG